MKTFVYWSLVAVLLAALAVVSAIHFTEREPDNPSNFLRSLDRQWIRSGDAHLFDITERAFNVTAMDGFKEGRSKWIPVGGAMTKYRPHFVSKSSNSTIRDDEFVLGVVNGEVSTAYPLRILAAHQVVNDTTQSPQVLGFFGRESFTVAAFAATNQGEDVDFWPAGLLWHGAELLGDLSTESLLTAVSGRFVSGRLIGRRLEGLPSAVVTLAQWLTLYPDSRIMTTNTGNEPREYPFLESSIFCRGPGSGRFTEEGAKPVVAVADDFHSAFVFVGGPRGWSAHQGKLALGDRELTVHYTDTPGGVYVTDRTGKLVHSIRTVNALYQVLLQ